MVTNNDSPVKQGKDTLWAVAILAGLTLALFWDLLFIPGDEVVSHIKGDTSQYHVFLRDLGFSEILRGNLPLWNPYIFSGTAFLGGMQSALLYPLNVVYLFLPIQKAINVDVALHLFLMGFFTFFWIRNWKIHWLGSLYAAIVVMLCGATYLRILAGQVNVVASLAWFPLLLLAIDRVVERASWKHFPSFWSLLGVAATTMLLYAGYPQALFICAVSAALYSLARLPQAENRIPALLELGVIGILPVFLGAIQLWTGFSIGIESNRGNSLSYEFCSLYSLPPENFITMVLPAFLGDNIRAMYWGRWGFWDGSLYIGVVSLLFVFYGFRSSHIFLKRISILIFTITLFISLGRFTPVHEWLFDYVPGFNKFRAPSKFLFVTSFFLAALAGLGVDRFLQESKRTVIFAYSSLILGCIFLLGASYFVIADITSEGELWWKLISDMKATPFTFVWVDLTPELVESTATLARNNLLVTSAVLFLLSMAIFVSMRKQHLKFIVVWVGIAELLFFAYSFRQTFRLEDLEVPALNEVLTSDLGTDRIITVPRWHIDESNSPIRHGALSAWGYDPVKLNRYGRFVSTLSTGYENSEIMEMHLVDRMTGPVSAGVYLGYLRFTPEGLTYGDRLFKMTRSRYVVRVPISADYKNYLRFIRSYGPKWPEDSVLIPDDEIAVHEVDNLMPRFSMMGDYRVIADHDRLLEVLDSPEFDPFKVVILEEEPVPVPGERVGDVSIEVLDESTDHVTLRVETSEAGILLITDAYSEGWQATALPGSVQDVYEVMPADLALRGIPLAAGNHVFRMEYLPAAFVYGRMGTFGGLGVFLILCVMSYIRRNRVTPVVE